MSPTTDLSIKLPDAELPMLKIETEVRIVETTHQLSNVMGKKITFKDK